MRLFNACTCAQLASPRFLEPFFTLARINVLMNACATRLWHFRHPIPSTPVRTPNNRMSTCQCARPTPYSFDPCVHAQHLTHFCHAHAYLRVHVLARILRAVQYPEVNRAMGPAAAEVEEAIHANSDDLIQRSWICALQVAKILRHPDP